MSPVTTYEDLHDTIRKRVSDNVVGYPIAWDNASFDSSTTEWLRATIEMGDAAQVSMGANTYRRPGNLEFQIFTTPDTGDEKALQIADLIVPFFRGKSVDGITWRTPSVRKVGLRQGWWQTNVSCPFFSNVVA